MNDPKENSGRFGPGILHRQHFKMNATENDEAMLARLAQLTGKDIATLKAAIAEGVKRNREEYAAMLEFTARYRQLLDRTPKIKKDKYEELTDAGRFLLKTKLPVSLQVPEKPPTYPDLVFTLGEEPIGLEHSRIINEQMKRSTSTTQKFLEDVAQIIHGQYPELSGIVNLFIDKDADVIGSKSFNTRNFSKDEREQIKSLIADFVVRFITKQTIERPAFILIITFEPNPGFPVSIDLGEQFFTVGGFRRLAEQRIEEKEKRCKAYQAESGLQRIWLLLVVDGVSSHSGFDLENEIFLYKKASDFELIIVFEVFSGRYYIIYDQHENG